MPPQLNSLYSIYFWRPNTQLFGSPETLNDAANDDNRGNIEH